VGEEGVEPSRLSAHDLKSCAAANYATRPYFFIFEAWRGIEPLYMSFADSCLATWLPRHPLQIYVIFHLLPTGSQSVPVLTPYHPA
ncbi:MAG: hypothetical protein G01um101429_557, partial [Parcubacteria group bacterium Gr01-1014_29]